MFICFLRASFLCTTLLAFFLVSTSLLKARCLPCLCSWLPEDSLKYRRSGRRFHFQVRLVLLENRCIVKSLRFLVSSLPGLLPMNVLSAFLCVFVLLYKESDAGLPLETLFCHKLFRCFLRISPISLWKLSTSFASDV